jgi:hypothetical protein
MGRALEGGYPFVSDFVNEARERLAIFESSRGNLAQLIFALGEMFAKHANTERRKLFHHSCNNVQWSCIERMKEAHAEWSEKAREALVCWTLVAVRCKLYKDVRQIISKMLWKERCLWSETSLASQRTTKRIKR